MRKTSSTLITAVLLLLCLGIVMLASTSSVRGAASFNDPQYFLKHQLVWMIIAFSAGYIVTRFDYHWWRKLSLPLLAASLLVLVLVRIPGIGREINGSWRWIRIGPISVQPSEFSKFAVIIGLARWMEHIGRKAERFVPGLVVPMCGLGVFLVLLLAEPDFGTTLLTGMVGMLILFAGGTRFVYLAFTAVIGGCGFVIAIMRDPVRMRRILAFIMPHEFPREAYHLAQSKIAFIMGGMFGDGLGNSIQKQFYLPEAHTDFILAIIGEELGFFATFAVVLLFACVLVCGIIISYNAPDQFGKLLAFGITMMISLQAAINVGVVTGCLPTKGLALPFISYGGSSLLMSIIFVGVLLNISDHCGTEDIDDHTKLIKDAAHRF